MSHDIDNEGYQIARMLDSSQVYRAADRLRDDLYNMDSRQFVDLVQAVNYYDRKGAGADLQIRSLGFRGATEESLVSVVMRDDRSDRCDPWDRNDRYGRRDQYDRNDRYGCRDDRWDRHWPPRQRVIREDIAIIRQGPRFRDDDFEGWNW